MKLARFKTINGHTEEFGLVIEDNVISIINVIIMRLLEITI